MTAGRPSTRTTLVPQPCFFSSFWLLVKGSQVLLNLPQLLPSFSLVICAKGTHSLSARAPAGLHRLSCSFQPMQWHHSHILQDKGPLRSQGPSTLQQLKWPAFFYWRSGFASAVQLVTGFSTRNWKEKPKISYFDWLILKRSVFLVTTLQNTKSVTPECAWNQNQG